MTPRATMNDVIDRIAVDAISPGQTCLAHSAFCQRTNLQDLFFRQFSLRCCRSNSPFRATLRNAVSLIGKIISIPQMRRIATRWVVARMTHIEFRPIAIGEKVGIAMGSVVLLTIAPPNYELAVPFLFFTQEPGPTGVIAAAAINAPPKASGVFFWSRMGARHLGPPEQDGVSSLPRALRTPRGFSIPRIIAPCMVS